MDDETSGKTFLKGIVVGLAVGGLPWLTVGGCVREGYYQREAILHDAAEWRIDARTGEATFTWIEKAD